MAAIRVVRVCEPTSISHARERGRLDIAPDVGCLLSEELGLQLRRVGSGKRLTFYDGEKRLSEWLAENAFVAWEVTPEPWLVEHALISAVPLPLSLDQNTWHAFCPTLAGIRRAAREATRALPVWRA